MSEAGQPALEGSNHYSEEWSPPLPTRSSPLPLSPALLPRRAAAEPRRCLVWTPGQQVWAWRAAPAEASDRMSAPLLPTAQPQGMSLVEVSIGPG